MVASISLVGRKAVLATMHGKEQVMAPVLAEALGLQLKLPLGFNTDRYGTFTRDVARAGSQQEAARQKALAAMELTGCSLGLASEGAFGPDPMFPWVACDREIVLLIDHQSGLELIGEAVSTATNYSQTAIHSVAEALQFAQAAQFPSHGLVAMATAQPTDNATIYKGITQETELLEIVRELLARQGSLWLETDMRAHVNPSRMAVIEQATHNLVKRFQQCCPQCGWPGYDVALRLPGLPCAACALPTGQIQRWVYRCQRCAHGHEVLFPEGVKQADPSQCGFCNP